MIMLKNVDVARLEDINLSRSLFTRKLVLRCFKLDDNTKLQTINSIKQ